MADVSNEKKEYTPIAAYAVVEMTLGYKEAYVTIVPPKYGGADITVNAVESALREKGIVYGVDHEKVKEMVDAKRYDKQFTAACWLQPVNGENGEISYLFDFKNDTKPRENDDGFVDYRDLGIIRNITTGTVIAKIKLPTPGTPGIDLRNIHVPQIIGRKASFGIGDNTALSEDGTEITATADGHLRFSNGRFCVDTTVVIGGDVDASVGHIEFLGDVLVKGEVREGFRVSSQKNITVYGNVTGGTLVANGDITIRKGSINSNIKSHGNIKMTFCEYSNIECDGDLQSTSYTFCNVNCAGQLIASGSPGVIVGGQTVCLKNLTANTIGSRAYTKTHIVLGDNAIMFEEKNRALLEIKRLEEEIIKCGQIMDFLAAKKKELKTLPPDKEEMFSNAFKTKIVRQKEKSVIERKIEEIDVHLREKQDIGVNCKREMFPGVTIIINDSAYTVNDMIKTCRITLSDDGFKFGSLY